MEQSEFVLKEFINDLSLTFPEYKEELLKYSDMSVDEFSKLSGQIYAENFFDILYKNEKIFDDSKNTDFIPNIKFSKFNI